MLRRSLALGLLSLGLLSAGVARAERVPSARAGIPPSHGARPDLRVPYLTNGDSGLGIYYGVGPRIYSAPAVTNPGSVAIQPGFNLPFQGGSRGFNTWSDGATPRPQIFVRPR